jgi:hypothetical protein
VEGGLSRFLAVFSSHFPGHRPDADGGTTFTTASGQAMTFARGPVRVVLAAAT